MKKILAALLILAGLGLAGLVARRTVENDRDYQRLIRQGDEALSRGQPYGAIEAFSAAIDLKPGSMLAYLKRGEAHRRGDTPEMLRLAVVDLRRAAELDPSATRPMEELGDVDFQRGRYLNAVESYQAYLQLDDSSALVSYKLALAARGAGDLPTAVAALQEAVRLNPSFAQAHYVMGLCLKDRGQLRDAQKSFEKALAINAALIPAREEMAELHRLQAQTREEIEQLEALAALDPSHAERLIAVGLAYSRTGNPELAVTA